MIEIPFLKINQNNKTMYLTSLTAKILTEISYSAVRGIDDEVGAVQRALNSSRIAGVKDFALNVGDFPSTIVLNWTKGIIEEQNELLRIPIEERSAQIIDGQHRVAGIAEAIKEHQSVGDLDIPVTIYKNLTTRECANIFLSINTEQRPVPRSLVYDLFGLANEELVDPAVMRARDIVLALDGDDMPYSGLIKRPNARRQRGGIQLSTAVTAIKPLVEAKGTFEQIGIVDLELQTAVISNFFDALSEKYADQWWENTNAFIYASGFIGAIEFFQLRLVPYCVNKKSFERETITDAIQLNPSNLIRQEEVKGLGGKDAPKKVFERLVSAFEPIEDKKSKFKF